MYEFIILSVAVIFLISVTIVLGIKAHKEEQKLIRNLINIVKDSIKLVLDGKMRIERDSGVLKFFRVSKDYDYKESFLKILFDSVREKVFWICIDDIMIAKYEYELFFELNECYKTLLEYEKQINKKSIENSINEILQYVKDIKKEN